MDVLQPGSTLFRRYRLERLLVAHASVAVWEATDLHYERRVQLSLYEDGSTVLDHGRVGGGNFVVVDPPHLEIVPEAFVPRRVAMAPPETRAWRWAAVGLACAILAVGGFWIVRDTPPPPMSAVTVTSARVVPSAKPPPPPPPPEPSAAPSEDPPPKPKPKPKKSWAEEPIRF